MFDRVRTSVAALVLIALAAVACGGATAAPRASTVTVVEDSRLGGILARSDGRTLYRFLPEKDGRISCTGTCSTQWQPLLLPGSGAPTSARALPGKLGTVVRPDGGRQVTYDEFPLYTYAGDDRAGTIAGEGFGGQWFAARLAAPRDVDGDSDGTTPSATPTDAQSPGQPAAAPPVPVTTPVQTAASPPAPRPVPPASFNDHDGDNSGGPSDGDGNG